MRTNRTEADRESASSKEESSSIVAEELRFRKITKVAKKMREVPPSRVFTMFSEGISPMDVVVQTDADPAIIQDWFRRWIVMNEDWRMWCEHRAKTVQLKMLKDIEAHAKLLIKGLEVEADEKLEQLKRQLGSDEVIKLQGRKPSGLKAAVCYIIAKERGLSNFITQTRLSDYYEINTQTVWNDVKLLKQLMQNPVIK